MSDFTASVDRKLRVLSQNQFNQFYEEGFMQLDGIMAPESLDPIARLLDGLFDRFFELPPDLALDLGGKKNHDGPQDSPEINRTVALEPRLKKVTAYGLCEAVARDLLGRRVQLLWDHAIYKPPRRGSATLWGVGA